MNEADRTGERAPEDDEFAPEPELSPSDDPEVTRARAADDGTVSDGDPSDAEPAAAEPSAAERSTATPTTVPADVDEPLLVDATGYRDRWHEIQTGFVDEPGRAVQSAGELLTEMMDDLARRLASEIDTFDARPGAGGDVSTEDLRMTFQRYRSFFDRLLTA
jgi:hypothetical protein